MKAEKFSNALENVDDRYILQAAQAQPTGRTTVFAWKRWVAAAACLCLITGSVLLSGILPHRKQLSPLCKPPPLRMLQTECVRC